MAHMGENKPERTPSFNDERRRHRSPYRYEAMGLQLAHVRKKLDLSAIVLCDDLGQVVASDGNAEEVESLAQQTPWLAVTPEWGMNTALDYLNDTFPGVTTKQVALRYVETDGAYIGPLFVCGIGEASTLEGSMDLVASGLYRIIKTTILH